MAIRGIEMSSRNQRFIRETDPTHRVLETGTDFGAQPNVDFTESDAAKLARVAEIISDVSTDDFRDAVKQAYWGLPGYDTAE